MSTTQNRVTRQELSQFVIAAGDYAAAQSLSDALEEAFQIRLPVVSAQAAEGVPAIYVGTREFQNYGGYRCGISLEHGRLYVDGGAEELFQKASQLLLKSLSGQGIEPGSEYGYLWQGQEPNSGLHLEASQEETLCPGVTYMRRCYVRQDGEPVEAFAVAASGSSPARAAVWGSPQGQSQVVPDHVAQLRGMGRDVIAAVNADFFHFFHGGDKTTYGIQVIDGTVHKEPSNTERYGDHWFGVTTDGKYVMSDLDGYREKYRGKLWQAVGGGVWLMQKQRVCVPASASVDPRTAVGITKDGGLVLVCVDGRSPASAGATYADLLQVFMDLDVELETVLNLDGGHSTILMTKQPDGEMAIRNHPSSGVDTLRPIADILALVLPEQPHQ